MRFDLYVATKLNISRSRAKLHIEEGSVSIDGKIIDKVSFAVDDSVQHSVELCDGALNYVSRGGLKLEGALDAFGVDVHGKVCVDIGASTGGFTHCLLNRGAAKVYAVDSGTDQLADMLRQDSRVVSIEQFNARYMTAETLGETCDIGVADLSFISQSYILPAASYVISDGGEYIGLIKPQFECSRDVLSKKGIVKKGSDHVYAVKKVISSAVDNGFSVDKLMLSPIKGGDGNVEFLFHGVKNGKGKASCSLTDAEISSIVIQQNGKSNR